MVVVAAIIGILAVIVLVSHASFTNTVILTNTAYDVALSLRNAQSFGIGSRTIVVGAAFKNNVSYGIDISNTNGFIVYADTDGGNPACTQPNCNPGNNFYTNSDATFQTYTLNNGMKISQYCVGAIGGASVCNPVAEHISITFTRPNTNVVFAEGAIGQGLLIPGLGAPPFNKACITIASPDGKTRAVTVNKVGQIAVLASCP